MALSGSITGTYRGWTVRSDWSATQSVSGNYSDITVKHYLDQASSYSLSIGSRTNSCTVNGTTQNFTSGSISGTGTKYLGTTSYRVGHNNDGTKSCSLSTSFNVQATLSGTYVGSITASGTITLNTISRYPTISSAPNFNDTANPTITFSNPSQLYPIRCKIEAGGNTQLITRDLAKTATSCTFTLTSAERNLLYAKCPNSNTLTVRFTVCAMNGNTELNASYLDRTMTVTNANPTYTASYHDTNASVVAVTGNDQKIVQSKSTLAVKVTSAAALKGASLRTATCVLNGTTYSGNISGNSYTFNIGTLNISSNATATVTVADSRGNKTSKNLTIQMIAYYAPSAIITTERENNFYSSTTVNVDANYASVNGANSVTIRVRYKKTTDSSWSNYITFQDNVSQVLTLDNEYAWNLQTVITDLYSTITYNSLVSRGLPIVYFDRSKSSTGFNCFPDGERGVWSEGLQLDSNICIGSQVLYDAYVISTLTSVTILSVYDYDLIDGLFTNITIPTGYEKAIRISAQVSTSNANNGKVTMNNVSTSTVSTYSNTNFRKIVSSGIVPVSDITLETSEYNQSRQGLNLKLVNGGSTSGNAYFYNVTVHGYIVKSS